MWNRNLTNLRNVLAGLYWNVDEARRIVLEVQMNPAYISFHSKILNTWQSILEEAGHHNKVKDIIAIARHEYPSIQSLHLAEKNLLLSIEGPEMGDSDWHGPQGAESLEKIIGSISTLRPITFLQRGLEISRSVARVVLEDGSCGTGFLLKNHLLLTNSHVIPTITVAKGARVELNYQKTVQGLDASVDTYSLNPEDYFFTSPTEDLGGDDWTIVRIQGAPDEKWGYIDLAPVEPQVGDEVIIIQHPGGGPKQIALSHNAIVFADHKRLQYLTDTLEGSSGSPVFDTSWRVVALHHKGGRLREPGTNQMYFRNQGININVVIESAAVFTAL